MRMVDVMYELLDEHITADEVLAIFEEWVNLGARHPAWSSQTKMGRERPHRTRGDNEPRPLQVRAAPGGSKSRRGGVALHPRLGRTEVPEQPPVIDDPEGDVGSPRPLA
ncbi:MAG: hypothetical protein H0U79_04550 [Solirubrobacterales bacterium]|nr:hypothetical protein [Solirubrobacterales bacterium]